ncbi:hypothetical protein MPH_01350 [Macrophomina phaseolina MS6]|uniref:Uncharacterized protein n=1 Tax=Macrophomina phaseolina (strain MS6) TaxID=1126212 RepID=K2S307_MACPH|nr:hypothetical protein MPH_01350 [Macrophomina phaseolina MS6]
MSSMSGFRLSSARSATTSTSAVVTMSNSLVFWRRLSVGAARAARAWRARRKAAFILKEDETVCPLSGGGLESWCWTDALQLRVHSQLLYLAVFLFSLSRVDAAPWCIHPPSLAREVDLGKRQRSQCGTVLAWLGVLACCDGSRQVLQERPRVFQDIEDQMTLAVEEGQEVCCRNISWTGPILPDKFPIWAVGIADGRTARRHTVGSPEMRELRVAHGSGS